MNQQEQDKKLLECFKKVILPPYNYKHELGCKSCPKTHINWCNVQNLLAAQARISFQEGVEAERKKVDDLFCEWCMENEFVDESEAQNFRKLLTPPKP
jgi:hypothetical protein